MKENKITTTNVSPLEKEVNRLHANGKSVDIIAVRLGVKISRVLALISKPLATP